MTAKKPLGITDVVLRDAHQSILATRLRLEDMLPIAPKLDRVGFWSVETWGGATFDACIRYLGEDPWERIRQLKAAMPNTRQQMLLRGQNLLGYRHYADDVVDRFVERAAISGVDVFRVFDAMNDPRNMQHAMQAVKANGKHAQAAISYTTSPVHTLEMWVDLAKTLEDMDADSIAIKDMSGILNPYVAHELVSRLKDSLDVPVHMQCHATAGLSTAAIMKAVEAGIDNVDTSISSMSMTYGHSPTESVVAIFQGHERDTGLDLELLEEEASYYREVRRKYDSYEGTLRGVESRILVAQVPGGMLTNMESQLKEQGASDRFDEVLEEIPRVREDLGFIPLVTPTSQIVGTQAVLNVLAGERYKTITKETSGVLKGEYGAAPAPFNAELQARVLDGAEAVTCRPADLLDYEMDRLTAELQKLAAEQGIQLAEGEQLIDDVLTYALFPQIGLKFLENRNNPKAFEPAPTGKERPGADADEPAVYTVEVNGQSFVVQVNEGGDIEGIKPVAAVAGDAAQAPAEGEGDPQGAPLAGNIFKILVTAGQSVEEGEVLMILEAMKMETEICAFRSGTISGISVQVGDAVAVGDCLVTIA